MGIAFAIIIIILLFAGWFWFFGRRADGPNRLPVLMYHKVISDGNPDFLSIKKDMLELQFGYLKAKGYNTISLTQLEQYILQGSPLPAKPCLLTFDDGYRDNYSNMFPLLRKFDFKANIFLVAGFVNQDKKMDNGEEYLRLEEIKEISTGNVEFGLHSYEHASYTKLSLEEIANDISTCRTVLEKNDVPYVSCLAYTFGAFPKRDKLRRMAMFELFEAKKVAMAFRIGNRINRLPFKEKFLIQRLDVRGDESFQQFQKSLKFGKKLF